MELGKDKLAALAAVGLLASLALTGCSGYNSTDSINACLHVGGDNVGTNVAATMDPQAQAYRQATDPEYLDQQYRKHHHGSFYNQIQVGVGMMACHAHDGSVVMTVHGLQFARDNGLMKPQG